MLSALKEHINEGTTLHEVIFVAFTEELANAFKDAFEQILI